MELLRGFSVEYADGVTALAAIGTLALATITLLYLKKEYRSKYRPYVIPVVHAEPFSDGLGCTVSISPVNVGEHPCHAKLHDIELLIGDEAHSTPSTREWLLLAPRGVGIQLPAGYVGPQGVERVREGRYKSNRIELAFRLETRSVEGEFEQLEQHAYEIEVRGDTPQVMSRPEWRAAQLR